MSKKSRKNPTKAAVIKTAKRASAPVAKPANKAAAKPATKPVVKPSAKPAAKPAVKPTKALKPTAKIATAAKTQKPVAKVTKTAAKITTTATVAKAKAKKAAKVATEPVAKTAAAKAPVKQAASRAPAPKAVTRPAKTAAMLDTAAPITPVELAPAVAAEGALAPAFQLPRDGGAPVSLADYAGRKLVIFFYPRANTPGCTKEAIDFSRLAPAFDEAGAAILGVSADPLKAQESFRDKHDLATPLLSDLTHEMLKAYGAWGEKSMYGKTFEGVLRTTIAIGGDGRVARIWRNVKVDGHAQAVLEDVIHL
jgi:peroxiredoxin Q/BCP